MLRQVHPDLSPEWFVAAHRIEPWIFQLASAPKLLDMIERQIGPNITFWSLHLPCKPPHTGRAVPWHQDAKEWNLSGDFSASIWRRVVIFRYLAADEEIGAGTYHDYRTNEPFRASVLPGPRPGRERQGTAAQSILNAASLSTWLHHLQSSNERCRLVI